MSTRTPGTSGQLDALCLGGTQQKRIRLGRKSQQERNLLFVKPSVPVVPMSLWLYEESWRSFKEQDAGEGRAACLEGLGIVGALQGAPAWAARLWGTAAATRAAIGAPMPPVYRVSYGQAVAAARSMIGEEAFAAAWAEGRATPLAQALTTPSQEFATHSPAPGRSENSPA